MNQRIEIYDNIYNYSAISILIYKTKLQKNVYRNAGVPEDIRVVKWLRRHKFTVKKEDYFRKRHS